MEKPKRARKLDTAKVNLKPLCSTSEDRVSIVRWNPKGSSPVFDYIQIRRALLTESREVIQNASAGVLGAILTEGMKEAA